MELTRTGIKNMPNYPIKVVLVDESPEFRGILRSDLEKRKGLQVVAEAGDGISAIHTVQQHQPDALVMALVMPGMDGVDATKQIRRLSPDTKVIILTRYANRDNYERAIKAGATILITKTCTTRQVYRSILSCLYGESPAECSSGYS